MEENVISMQEIFSFNKKGIGPDGRVLGAFQPTRIRPRFVEQLRISGSSSRQASLSARCRSAEQKGGQQIWD